MDLLPNRLTWPAVALVIRSMPVTQDVQNVIIALYLARCIPLVAAWGDHIVVSCGSGTWDIDLNLQTCRRTLGEAHHISCGREKAMAAIGNTLYLWEHGKSVVSERFAGSIVRLKQDKSLCVVSAKEDTCVRTIARCDGEESEWTNIENVHIFVTSYDYAICFTDGDLVVTCSRNGTAMPKGSGCCELSDYTGNCIRRRAWPLTMSAADKRWGKRFNCDELFALATLPESCCVMSDAYLLPGEVCLSPGGHCSIPNGKYSGAVRIITAYRSRNWLVVVTTRAVHCLQVSNDIASVMAQEVFEC